jgi:citryl-CoA lyase
MPGVVAHLSEELRSNTRIRTLPEEIVEYRRDRHDLTDDLAQAGWSKR